MKRHWSTVCIDLLKLKSDSYLDLHLDRQHIFIAVRIEIKSLDNKFQANNCMMMIRHASCESELIGIFKRKMSIEHQSTLMYCMRQTFQLSLNIIIFFICPCFPWTWIEYSNGSITWYPYIHFNEGVLLQLWKLTQR